MQHVRSCKKYQGECGGENSRQPQYFIVVRFQPVLWAQMLRTSLNSVASNVHLHSLVDPSLLESNQMFGYSYCLDDLQASSYQTHNNTRLSRIVYRRGAYKG